VASRPSTGRARTAGAAGSIGGMTAPVNGLGAETVEFYRSAMGALEEAGVPFLVGGAYALERYTGIARHTKDFDVFVRPSDCDRSLAVLAEHGCQTDVTFSHWLAKAFRGDDFVDIIFSSGNGIATVDDRWFEHAVLAEVLGVPVRLCPVEEMIWSKSFIMERERYDGADVAHLMHAEGPRLDWARLLERFDRHWHVLMSHLVLYRFIYPCERDRVPAHVVRALIDRLAAELDEPPVPDMTCRGTILSREQYLVDVDHRGYRDARLGPDGAMTRRQIARWTAAIDEDT
jgi:hypothetical protein